MAASADANLTKIRGLIRFGKTTNGLTDKADGGNELLTLPVIQTNALYRGGNAVAWFPYGFHAAPEADNLALQFALEGNASNRVDLVGSPDRRPEIEASEVVVYHPASGSKILFKANGDVLVDAPLSTFTGDVVIEKTLTVEGDTDLNADLDVVGASTLSSTVTSGGVNISDTHVHTQGPDSGPDTQVPTDGPS